MAEWTTIESDPGVFTELMELIGVKNVEVEELYALDSDHLNSIRPVYGLIFLFKWQGGPPAAREAADPPGIFFANQVVTNACATQAILSILLNQDDSVDIGDELRNLKEFGLALDPVMRGEVIGTSDVIRAAHNSFSPPEHMLGDPSAPKSGEKEDAFHFVSYIHRSGCIWELDGLQSGPIKLAECSENEWPDRVGPLIQERITKYSEREIRFNLMALIRDRRVVLREQLKMLPGGGDDDIQIMMLQEQLREAEARRDVWRNENIRRKHNYVPFMYNFFKELAIRGELLPLIDRARADAPSKARRG